GRPGRGARAAGRSRGARLVHERHAHAARSREGRAGLGPRPAPRGCARRRAAADEPHRGPREEGPAAARRARPQEGGPGAARQEAMSGDRARLLALLTARSFAKKKVVLASGKESDFFIDCKQTVLSAEGHALTGALMFEALPPCDAVAGVEL